MQESNDNCVTFLNRNKCIISFSILLVFIRLEFYKICWLDTSAQMFLRFDIRSDIVFELTRPWVVAYISTTKPPFFMNKVVTNILLILAAVIPETDRAYFSVGLYMIIFES